MWISPDCHGIVAVLVISGKQPSSGLLHTLRFICVCVWPLSAVCYNIASSSHRGSTLVFPGTRSHVSPHRLTSTTQPLCHGYRVYHNFHNIQAYTHANLRLVLCWVRRIALPQSLQPCHVCSIRVIIRLNSVVRAYTKSACTPKA